jgi:hypothetical protein
MAQNGETSSTRGDPLTMAIAGFLAVVAVGGAAFCAVYAVWWLWVYWAPW